MTKILNIYTRYMAVWVAICGIIAYLYPLLNIWGMSSGYTIAKFLSMNIPRRRTLSIEIGMQNAGSGTVLALKHFNERVAIPAACFVFVCILTAAIMAEFWGRVGDTNER